MGRLTDVYNRFGVIVHYQTYTGRAPSAQVAKPAINILLSDHEVSISPPPGASRELIRFWADSVVSLRPAANGWMATPWEMSQAKEKPCPNCGTLPT